jgi:branched-chain amino acid aminotransferase|tara:strand:+ start:28301 stop:29209 length:909 start_codon:yes stop_codon:yes gene_type:complete
MEEAEKIWMDGKFVDWKKANIHILTHTFHYGAGVFEGIRCYNTDKGPAIFRLKEHIDRLFNSADIIGIKVPYSKEDFLKACKEIVKVNKLNSCYLRPIIYYGYGQLGVNPLSSPVNCAIAAWSWGKYLGEEGVAKGIRLMKSSFTRNNKNILNPAKVNGNYVNSVLAKKEAVSAGFEEAVLLDNEDFVSECSGENLFIVKNGVIKTVPKGSILPGITRDTVLKVAQDMKHETKEELFRIDELYNADECFLTGTAAEITPVREVDNKTIGNGKPGEITKKLQKLYSDIVQGKVKEYDHWLDYV